MNYVIMPSNKITTKEFKLKDLTLENKGTQTAFIGRCGLGPDRSLYLVTYNRIILANDPDRSWSSPNCSVLVDRFVDVEIKVL